ncbi:hypothetical protein ADIWIN_3670 [Winogradskyella psychrotolerans RS-3]|uniref:Uncharacterized protein n=1 Tax=Winogradskyella psychrotolerans RS-3 TaxID=641526 RepID=S7WU89_9FLAO|nr:hypothetical protein [Winogradskyella psychrotolerans]EPR70314.1 hypothetical protein ADIWIN_3670 [Winogradskyella psychrotolerans RS-3]
MSIQAQNTVGETKVFATTEQAVGYITFTDSGDLVYSHHPFFSPENRVMLMDAKSKITTPFPNKAWNTPRSTDNNYLSNVFGIRNDKNEIVWMLDMAQPDNVTPKIAGWNTKTNQLERIYYLPKFTFPENTPTVINGKHLAVNGKHQKKELTF